MTAKKPKVTCVPVLPKSVLRNVFPVLGKDIGHSRRRPPPAGLHLVASGPRTSQALCRIRRLDGRDGIVEAARVGTAACTLLICVHRVNPARTEPFPVFATAASLDRLTIDWARIYAACPNVARLDLSHWPPNREHTRRGVAHTPHTRKPMERLGSVGSRVEDPSMDLHAMREMLETALERWNAGTRTTARACANSAFRDASWTSRGTSTASLSDRFLRGVARYYPDLESYENAEARQDACTDKGLFAIARHCKWLESIEIAEIGEADTDDSKSMAGVTDAGVNARARMPRLLKIHLRATHYGARGMLAMMEHAPHASEPRQVVIDSMNLFDRKARDTRSETLLKLLKLLPLTPPRCARAGST